MAVLWACWHPTQNARETVDQLRSVITQARRFKEKSCFSGVRCFLVFIIDPSGVKLFRRTRITQGINICHTVTKSLRL